MLKFCLTNPDDQHRDPDYQQLVCWYLLFTQSTLPYLCFHQNSSTTGKNNSLPGGQNYYKVQYYKSYSMS